MKTSLTWKEGMLFHAESHGITVPMDTKPPIGKGSAASPKELILMGLAGCTAMDVIALMKKHKQPVESFAIEVNAPQTEGKQPHVFINAEIEFKVKGKVDKQILLESVHLSQSKYCGVSAMLSKAFPIHYTVMLNGEHAGEGNSDFSEA